MHIISQILQIYQYFLQERYLKPNFLQKVSQKHCQQDHIEKFVNFKIISLYCIVLRISYVFYCFNFLCISLFFKFCMFQNLKFINFKPNKIL